MRDPLHRCLNTVAKTLVDQLAGARFLEYFPDKMSAMYLYQGEVYRVAFLPRIPDVNVFQYQDRGVLLNINAVTLDEFNRAYRGALKQYLSSVVRVRNTDYVAQELADYLLRHHSEIMAA